jgi:hypothetical protein
MYPYGFKFAEDVEVGDQLMGDDGSPREVLELYRGREEMARIKYHDETYYDVNMSHKLALVCTSAYRNQYKVGDKYIMSVRDFLKLSPTARKGFHGYKVSVDYPELPVVIPPYILGLWLGDGDSSRARLSNTDEKLIAIWCKFAQTNGLSVTSYDNNINFDIVRSADTDNLFLRALQHYNLINNKHIPKEYLFNSKEVRLALLAGLIDTDGYCRKANNSLQYEIVMANRSMVYEIQFLAQSCGMHATVKEFVGSWKWKGETRYNTHYKVSISRNVDMIPTQLPRKQGKSTGSRVRNHLHFGFTVELLPEDNYYGFEVDRNHLYVLGDFTVTHNTGKDAAVSWIIIWFMTTRPYAKVACTAPTNRQLHDILVSEISKWLRRSVVSEEFIIRKDAIQHKDAPKEWWVRFISPSVKSTKEEQAETLAGLHGDHLLIVADEASGIPDPVYIPLEGAMTQPDNKAILIGNMTKNTGYFYDTHFHSEIKHDWIRLHWDSRSSSIVDPSMPEYFARKYGVDSNIYRIRVCGDPPLQDDTALIPLWAAEQCIGKEIVVAEDEPLYLGVDVARYGDDASIILPRRGLNIMPWEEFRKLNTIDLGGFVNQTYSEIGASGCAIDVIGVGAGVADWLEKHGMRNLYQVNVAMSSSDITKYNRLRDELWCRVRDNCLLGKYSFPDLKRPGETESLGSALASELASIRYKFNAHGGIKVEGKMEMKARGIPSPNIADALCLTEYFSNSATRVFSKNKPDYEMQRRYVDLHYSSQSWMA